MRSALAFGACMLMLNAIGCSSVTSPHPLGTPAKTEDAKRLEGVWLTSEGDPCQIRHVEKNEMRVCSVGWREKEFKLHEFSMYVTVDDGQVYLNVLGNDNEPDEGEYTFLRLVSHGEDVMLLNVPNVNAFETAVNEGKLTGTVEKKKNSKTVRLSSSQQQLADFVNPDQVAEQFEIDPSLVLRRVKSFND